MLEKDNGKPFHVSVKKITYEFMKLLEVKIELRKSLASIDGWER